MLPFHVWSRTSSHYPPRQLASGPTLPMPFMSTRHGQSIFQNVTRRSQKIMNALKFELDGLSFPQIPAMAPISLAIKAEASTLA